MSKRKRGRVVPARAPERADFVAYAWPCGCVTIGSRTGPVEQDCGDVGCYRREHQGQRPIRILR